MSILLNKLRAVKFEERAGLPEREESRAALREFHQSGVKFVATHSDIEDAFYKSVFALTGNIYKSASKTPFLIEGHVYIGCWLESTGTICAEILSRFCPEVARSCFELFADHQRDDGLIPYKVTDQAAYYRQIQIMTPLARSVWNHYQRNGQDNNFLRKMYDAMAANDQWLAVYRNTRGTGCVEAFCTFDTGNDASPRFWHVNDIPHQSDPTKYDPDSPILPFLAPDMTANIYCQRKYLARMAEVLGENPEIWLKKAQQSLDSLMKYCYDETDQYFYDRDKNDKLVKVQSDLLIKVMACEVGDDDMFRQALQRYLLNTRKFFSRYPLTAVALDEPRFDHNSIYYNSHAGSVGYNSAMRVVHPFEYHGRYVELSWIMQPFLSALSRAKKFSGGVNPWTGEEGDSVNFTGSMLCLFDYLERFSGIYPTPDQKLWFSTLIPYGQDHGRTVAEGTGYSRKIAGNEFELINEMSESRIYINGQKQYEVPRGIRVITDLEGKLTGMIGITARDITGSIKYGKQVIPFKIAANQELQFTGSSFILADDPGLVMPVYE